MTINLNASCKNVLLEKLRQALSSIEVRNGHYLTRDLTSFAELYLADCVIPETKKQKDGPRSVLSRYIDGPPLLNFVQQQLSFELQDNHEYISDETPVKLTTLPEYEDLNVLSQRLVEQFLTLPWEYTLTFEFPQKISEVFLKYIPDFSLHDTIKLTGNFEALERVFPQTSGIEKRDKNIHAQGLLGLLGGGEKPTWKQNTYFLQITRFGYVPQYGGGINTDLEARRIIKAFFGIGIALDVFSIKTTYYPYPPKQHLFVHKKEADEWKIISKLEMENDEAQAISSICMSDFFQKFSDEDKKGFLTFFLNKIGGSLKKNQQADLVMLAAQWLFDSYMGHDTILNFVRGMIVLEILLGEKTDESDEKNKIGLGELLRNRCAYLISDNKREREEIIKDFKDIYRVRSQIVHSGKHRLSSNEFALFSKLRSYCKKVIRKEIQLLIKAPDEEKGWLAPPF